VIIEVAIGVFIGLVLFYALPEILTGALLIFVLACVVAAIAGAIAIVVYFPEQTAFFVAYIVVGVASLAAYFFTRLDSRHGGALT